MDFSSSDSETQEFRRPTDISARRQQYFNAILQELTTKNDSICNAMFWCILNSVYAEYIVTTIIQEMKKCQLSMRTKFMFLLNDILHNTAKFKDGWKYNLYIQNKLGEILDIYQQDFAREKSRLRMEKHRKGLLQIIEHWKMLDSTAVAKSIEYFANRMKFSKTIDIQKEITKQPFDSNPPIEEPIIIDEHSKFKPVFELADQPHESIKPMELKPFQLKKSAKPIPAKLVQQPSVKPNLGPVEISMYTKVDPVNAQKTEFELFLQEDLQSVASGEFDGAPLTPSLSGSDSNFSLGNISNENGYDSNDNELSYFDVHDPFDDDSQKVNLIPKSTNLAPIEDKAIVGNSTYEPSPTQIVDMFE